jgi:hypothetical protein
MRLVIVDTTGIQPYIFGSNRLRENIGGSHLVAEATGRWALEAMGNLRSNIRGDRSLDDSLSIENGEIAAEVIYSGGGNFIALFGGDGDDGGDGEVAARQFIGRLSRQVLREAPGLQLVLASREFRWNEPLTVALKQSFAELKIRKNLGVQSLPLAGLGVTVPCQSTGLPATGMSDAIGGDAGYPVSAEIQAKLNQAGAAGERLREMLPIRDGYGYPIELDDLGRSRGEFSYIAVVHADGNGIGKRISDLENDCTDSESNRRFILKMRHFSAAVAQASQGALKGAIEALLTRIDNDRIVNAQQSRMTLRLMKSKETDKLLLPFRPIVFGGDDLTFVCDGRLGITLTIEYLRRFEELTTGLPDGGGAATACAGIAIVKAHYPFVRAYQMAEELCSSAKGYLRKNKLTGNGLDWHFATGGLLGGIEEIRRREYATGEGSLTQRPVTLRDNPKDELRAWPVVRTGVESFQSSDWAERRNKVKALRDALRDGSAAVESFLAKYNGGNYLPNVAPQLGTISKSGWHGNVCGYFDAIELVDWYYAL